LVRAFALAIIDIGYLHIKFNIFAYIFLFFLQTEMILWLASQLFWSEHIRQVCGNNFETKTIIESRKYGTEQKAVRS